MKNRFILLVVTASLLSFVTSAQKRFEVDTVIDRGIYKSYFNYAARNPLFVTYTLQKGGGDCDRNIEGFDFYVDEFNATATNDDYKGNGYHKGHLANAEDFAYNCDKEESTFRYYNCVPQMSKMNLGVWKSWEKKIREVSQSRKLYIIAGSIFGSKTIGDNHIAVPSFMYKVVFDSISGQLLYCHLFPNDASNTYKDVTLTELKKKIGYSTKSWKAE